MNRRCPLEPLGTAVGSILVLGGRGLVSSKLGLCSACFSGFSSARCSRFTFVCCSGTTVACSVGFSVVCCSGTFLFPLDCSSMRVLHDGICTLGRGATGSSSSSDHSITAALRVRVVWLPPCEMPPGSRGAAVAVLLFFWVSSSAAARFPRDFSDTRGDSPCDQNLSLDSDEISTELSSGCTIGQAFTTGGQSTLGMPEKYTALSCEWIFA